METITPYAPSTTTPLSTWAAPPSRQPVNGKRIAAIVGIAVFAVVAIVATLVLSFKVAHLNDRVSTVTRERNTANGQYRAAADDAKKAHDEAASNQRHVDNVQTDLNAETIRRGKCATAAEHFEAISSFFAGARGAPSPDGNTYINDAYANLKACQNAAA